MNLSRNLTLDLNGTGLPEIRMTPCGTCGQIGCFENKYGVDVLTCICGSVDVSDISAQLKALAPEVQKAHPHFNPDITLHSW